MSIDNPLRKKCFIQFTVFLFPANDAVENDVALIDAAYLSVFDTLSRLAQGFQALVEVPMGLEDHAKVLATALSEKLERRHPVEEDAVGYSSFHPSLRQVFHQ